jgi:hypothetical protein
MLHKRSFAVMLTYIESKEIDLSTVTRENHLKGIMG